MQDPRRPYPRPTQGRLEQTTPHTAAALSPATSPPGALEMTEALRCAPARLGGPVGDTQLLGGLSRVQQGGGPVPQGHERCLKGLSCCTWDTL